MNLFRKLFKKPGSDKKEQSTDNVPAVQKDIPAFCLLVVNKQCNFHCRICNMWKHKEDPRSLSLDEMKKIVLDLKTFVDEPIFIHLIGGETLLWPHTAELARFITDNGFRTSITTNGYLIDKSMAEKLVDSRMSGIFISLDSLDEKRHDFIRGMDGAHAQVMHAINYLDETRKNRNADTSIGLTFTISQYNVDETIAFADWAQNNDKVNDVFFNAVLQPFDSGEDSKDWYAKERYKEVWPQDLDYVHNVLDQLIERKKRGAKICNPPEQLVVLKEYFKEPFRFRQNLKIKCTRGDIAPEVNAVGDISMCFFMKPLGNVRTHNIRDIWFSEEMKKMREDINNCRLECDLAVNCFYKIENITDYVST